MTASAEKDWTRNSDNERFLVMFVRNIIFNNVEKCFVATKLGDKISPVNSLRVENLLFFINNENSRTEKISLDIRTDREKHVKAVNIFQPAAKLSVETFFPRFPF